MQEEVTQKTIALSMKTGKLTAQALQAALKKYMETSVSTAKFVKAGEDRLRIETKCGG